jgi:hypothetical protein
VNGWRSDVRVQTHVQQVQLQHTTSWVGTIDREADRVDFAGDEDEMRPAGAG